MKFYINVRLIANIGILIKNLKEIIFGSCQYFDAALDWWIRNKLKTSIFLKGEGWD